jgi:hypothetical protein
VVRHSGETQWGDTVVRRTLVAQRRAAVRVQQRGRQPQQAEQKRQRELRDVDLEQHGRSRLERHHDLLGDVSTLCAVLPPPGLYGVVGTGLLWDVSTRCAVEPPPGLFEVVGTGLLWDVSTRCAVVPPPGLYGVVGNGLLWDVSTLCAVLPPAGLYGVVGTGLLWDVSTLCAVAPPAGLYGVWCLLRGLSAHNGLRSRWGSRMLLAD